MGETVPHIETLFLEPCRKKVKSLNYYSYNCACNYRNKPNIVITVVIVYLYFYHYYISIILVFCLSARMPLRTYWSELNHFYCQLSMVSMVTSRWPGRFWVWLAGCIKIFSCSPKLSKPHLEPSPSLLFYGYQNYFPQEKSGRSVNLTAHLHLVSKFRMSGGVPLFSLHVCVAYTGNFLLLLL